MNRIKGYNKLDTDITGWMKAVLKTIIILGTICIIPSPMFLSTMTNDPRWLWLWPIMIFIGIIKGFYNIVKSGMDK